MDTDQLFQSTHQALTFAYNFQGSPALSIMNRMSHKPGPTGRGLAGLDGAGMAGVIRRHVKELGTLREAIIIAEFAPRSQPCPCRSPCCSGQVRNQEWVDAINNIADFVRSESLESHRTTHRIRRALVEVYFGLKMPNVKVAEALEITQHTFGQMLGKVRRSLKDEQGKARAGADDALIELMIREVA